VIIQLNASLPRHFSFLHVGFVLAYTGTSRLYKVLFVYRILAQHESFGEEASHFMVLKVPMVASVPPNVIDFADF
jgi:hypothetical protein